jgi:hypothetical protein
MHVLQEQLRGFIYNTVRLEFLFDIPDAITLHELDDGGSIFEEFKPDEIPEIAVSILRRYDTA